MTLKERLIQETGIRGLPGNEKVSVKFVDNIQSLDDYNELTEYGSHYAFAGLFKKGSSTHYYFADARRHDEMKRAIEQELGGGQVDHYLYGQIHPGRDGLISQLILHEDPGRNDNERQRVLSGFLDRVSLQFMSDRVLISWELHIKYDYFSKEKKFVGLKSSY